MQSMWKHKCTVIVYENIRDPKTGITRVSEKILHNDVPCHLRNHYYLKDATDEKISDISQRVSVFVDIEIDVPEGAKVIVNKGNFSRTFEYAGLAVVYDYHKEIPLAIKNRRV